VPLENKVAPRHRWVTGHRSCYRAAARPRRRARCLNSANNDQAPKQATIEHTAGTAFAIRTSLGSQDDADTLVRDLDAQGLHRFDVLVNNAAVGLRTVDQTSEGAGTVPDLPAEQRDRSPTSRSEPQSPSPYVATHPITTTCRSDDVSRKRAERSRA
jgi:NAD(P)-dependent dehydrogenase (short-subunit alcohol dehydrogenase family)